MIWKRSPQGSLFFLLLTLFLCLCDGQNDFQSDVFISNMYNHKGLQVSINETTGETVIKPAQETGIITIRGKTGATGRFVVQNEYNVPGPVENSIFDYEVNLGTIIYEYDIEPVAYVPKLMGLVKVEVPSVNSETEKNRRDLAEKIVKEGTISSHVKDGFDAAVVRPDLRSKKKKKRSKAITGEEEIENGGRINLNQGEEGKLVFKHRFSKDLLLRRGRASKLLSEKQSETLDENEYQVELISLGEFRILKASLAFLLSRDMMRESFRKRIMKEIEEALESEPNLVFSTSILETDSSVATTVDEVLRLIGEGLDPKYKRKDANLYFLFQKIKDLEDPEEFEETEELLQASEGNYWYPYWRLRKSDMLQSTYVMRLGDKEIAAESQTQTEGENETQKKRKKRWFSVLGTWAAHSMDNPDFLKNLGGACATIKQGGGISQDLNTACQYQIADVVAENQQRIGVLENQVAGIFDALLSVNDALELMKNIQKELQEQSLLQQQQLDVQRQELVNTNLRLNDIMVMMNQHSLAIESLITAVDRIQISVQRLEYTMNQNFQVMSDQLVGLSNRMNEQIATLQGQLYYVEQRARANTEMVVKNIYVDMAILNAKLTGMIGQLGVDIDARLGLLVNDISYYLNENREATVVNSIQIQRLMNMVISINKGIRDLFRHNFGASEIALQYYVFKEMIENQDHLTPYVIKGRGRPPPKMKEPTLRDGVSVAYSFVSPARCNLTEGQNDFVKGQMASTLHQHAKLTLMIPIAKHNDYLHYSAPVSTFVDVADQNMIGYYFIMEAVDSRYVMGITTGDNTVKWFRLPEGGSAEEEASKNNLVVSCYLASGETPTYEPKTVRDGDKLAIACNRGQSQFILQHQGNFLNFAPGSIDGLPSAPEQVFQIRNAIFDLSLSNEHMLRYDPFTQERGFLLHRYPSSGQRYENTETIPFNHQTMGYSPGSFAPSLNLLPGQPVHYVGRILFERVGRRIQTEGILQNLITEEAFNATVDYARSLFDDPKGRPYDPLNISNENFKKRKRSAHDDEPPSRFFQQKVFDDCYEGITHFNHPNTVKFSLLSQSNGHGGPNLNTTQRNAQDLAMTCSKKPSCSYYFIKEPVHVSHFAADFATGSFHNFEGAAATRTLLKPDQFIDMSQSGWRSIIIPPSVLAQPIHYPVLPWHSTCRVGTYDCLSVSLAPSCQKTAHFNPDAGGMSKNSQNHDNYCSGALLKSRNDDDDPDDAPVFWQSAGKYPITGALLNAYDNNYNIHDKEFQDKVCHGHQSTIYMAACVNRMKSTAGCRSNIIIPYKGPYQFIYDYDDRANSDVRAFTCGLKPNVATGASFFLSHQLTKYLGSEIVDLRCIICRDGYGVNEHHCPTPAYLNDPANKIFPTCPPRDLEEAAYGTNNKTYWSALAPENRAPGRYYRKRVGDLQSWGFCGPSTPDSTALTNKHARFKIPYFVEPGDAGPLGTLNIPGAEDNTRGYPLNGVPIIAEFVNCEILGSAEASCRSGKGDIYEGMCIRVVDVQATTKTNIGFKCVHISRDPCISASSVDECLDRKDSGLPICFWDRTNSSCANLIVNIWGASTVQPKTGKAYPENLPDHIPPCYWRIDYLTSDANVPAYGCTFDGRCLLINYASATSETRYCVPMANGHLLSKPYSPTLTDLLNSIPGYPSASAVQSFLNNTLKIDSIYQRSCMLPKFGCYVSSDGTSLEAGKATGARLYFLLWKSVGKEGFNVPVNCGAEASGEDKGVCGFKYTFLANDPLAPPVNITAGGWLLEDGLVSKCSDMSAQCRADCRTYGRDMNACLLQGEACFVSRIDFRCYPLDGDSVRLVCPNTTATLFEEESDCLRWDNFCNIFSIHKTVDGAPLNYTIDGYPLDNDGNLTLSECAKVAGRVTGNMTLTKTGSSRFSDPDIVFPQGFRNLCIAKAAPNEQRCVNFQYVGVCRGDICNLMSDPIERLMDEINIQHCAFYDLPSCILATSDKFQTFPCAWVQTSSKLGRCAQLRMAESMYTVGKGLTIYTIETYRAENFKKSVLVKATAVQLASLGINVTADVQLGLHDPESDIVSLAPIELPCPEEGWIAMGAGCCRGNNCEEWIPNPWHPKNVFIEGIRNFCTRADTDVTVQTLIGLGCFEKNTSDVGINELPSGNRHYYTCEGFIDPDKSSPIFQFVVQNERQNELLWINDEQKMMTPIHTYEQLDINPKLRQLNPIRNFLYMNTIFEFDYVVDLLAVSMGNPSHFVRHFNLTEDLISTPDGYFRKSTLTGRLLGFKLADEMRNYLNTMNTFFGPFPAAWGTTADPGVKLEQVPAGITNDGHETTKTDVLHFAYGSKRMDEVPVWRVVSSRSQTTEVLTKRQGVEVGDLQNPRVGIPTGTTLVANPFESYLFSPGDQFIFYNDTDYVYGVPHSHIGLGEEGMVGYIHVDQPQEEFNTTEYILTHPYFDASKALLSPDHFKTARVPNAEKHSLGYYCGQNTVSLVDKNTPEIQIYLLNLTMNLQGISAEQELYWTLFLQTLLEENENGILERLEAFQDFMGFIKEKWLLYGCLHEFVNYQTEGQRYDFLYTLKDAFYTFELGQNKGFWRIDGQKSLEDVLFSVVSQADRIHCGNCLLYLNGGDGQSGACDITHGNKFPPKIPTLEAIDVQRTTHMVFCLPSNFYKVEFLPELKKMRFTLKSGLGDVTSSWRVAANEGINQYSTQDICVNNPVNASFPSVGAGTYQIKIENPHPFPVSFVLRLRTNFTNLYDPLSVVRNRLIQQARADGETLTLESLNNDLCNIDSSQSLPAETTHTLSIPICPDILFFIQVYNLGGRPCSQVIQSEIDYTSVGLNRTQNVVVVERITNNVVLQTAREIENSLNEMRKEITVEIEDIKLTLADSFFKLNGSNEFLTNSYRALNDILSNQQSGVVNIWNRVVVAEVLFQRLNTSYSDVSAALNEVRAFTQAVRERSEVLLDDVFVGIERLDNLTVLSNAVYESAARNEINFMVLEDKIAEINNLIETAKGLGPAVEILNAIDKDNVEANKSLTMLISVVGSVAGLALIVFLGYIYYKTKKRSQKYSQMQGNDEDGGDQQ